MKNFLKKLLNEDFYNYLKNIYFFLRCFLISDYKATINDFKKAFGYTPDFKNPITFNEKIQWRKLYDNNPKYSLCSDKVLVRDYVKEQIGEQYLINALFITDDAKKIDFDKLPDSFVIKANHGSGWNILVRDKKNADINKIITTCNRWLKSNYYYYSRESHYKNIKSQLIIEEMLSDESGNEPKDYKFHVFNNNIEFIQIDVDRFKGHKRILYDENWNKLDFALGPFEIYQENISKPEKFDEMKDIVKKLSSGFSYVRVDLYTLNDKIYFGELTFTPGNGYVDKFTPEEYDKYFGGKFNLN